MRRAKILLLAVLLIAGLDRGVARSAEPVKIRMAWTVVPFEIMPVLFTVPDVMKHLGKSYTVEFPHFQSSSSMFAPLASGDIDIASMSAFTFTAAVQRAGMSDLRVLSDEYEDGVEGYLSGQFVVLKDGPIQKIEDLKGKVVASFGIGSSGDMASRLMLHKHGLEDKRDYTVIEANGNNMPAMLFDHKVDLINTTGFTAHDPDVIAKTRSLFDRRQAFGGPSQETVIVGRAGFVEKNRAALVDYFEDELRALNWCLDPKNHTAAIALIAAFTKAPASRFDSWMFTKDDEYRDPKGMPKLADFQHAIDVEHEFGLIQNPIEVNKYTDLSLVKEAAARLK
jgi:sulfonate transport system substrate-binding protein